MIDILFTKIEKNRLIHRIDYEIYIEELSPNDPID